MPDLIPYPLAALVRRMFRESELHDAIFDLPRRKWFLGDPELDFTVSFHGKRASSPLGPAAGPQTQLAQNIALSWLGGCRIMELKTVQIMDELVIPRPCIDMRTVGYNAEWSQELKLEESLDEYVKGMMLIEILRESGLAPVTSGFEHTIYDMSVGYDLKGIQSDRVQQFVRGMRDATAVVDRLRAEIPSEFAQYRDLEFPTALSNTLTLSTFHGCPPEEIEGIIDFLLHQGIHCVIKFNPMLLGPVRCRELLHDVMGYTDIEVPDSAFTRDASWEQATGMMERLGKTAQSLGLSLGAKFSNTLIVHNTAGFLAPTEKEVYLSGAPLHVLAVNLVAQFREHFGDRFPISFAAGIDRGNFADVTALGLTPITVCSDLLLPQGYGRLQAYNLSLSKQMKALGAKSIEQFVMLSAGSDAGSLSEARLKNTAAYAAAVCIDPRYGLENNSKLPKKIGSMLTLFDCVSCDKCIPVCPNDANFSFVPEDDTIRRAELGRLESGEWEWRELSPLLLEQKHQIANFADFCNECGNCDVFCPEDGGPYVLKPRFFGSEAAFRDSKLDGFFVSRHGAKETVLARFGVEEFSLSIADGRHTVCGPGFEVVYDPEQPGEFEFTELPPATASRAVLTPAFIMDCVRRAVLRPDQVNYVNMLVSSQEN